MDKINGRPVYSATIEDLCQGMTRISLVDYPAVNSNFLKFRKEKEEKCLFSIKDEEKQLVYGVIMRADYPIFRVDWISDHEYYMVFSKETIRQMAEKYLLESRENEVSVQHQNKVDGVHMVQMFIKDEKKGICPKGFEDISDGSLFGEFHVVNNKVWEKIKSGEFRGFSLEGAFEIRREEDRERIKELEEINKGLEFKKDNKMNKFKKLMSVFRKFFTEFTSISTDKGILYWDGGEEITEGDKVYSDENLSTPAESGDYIKDNGEVIKVKDGVVESITQKEEKPKEEEETPKEEEEEEEKPKGGSLEDRVKALEEKIEDILTQLKEKEEEEEEEEEEEKMAKQAFEELKREIIELKKIPVANPPHVDFKKIDNKEKQDIRSVKKLTILNY